MGSLKELPQRVGTMICNSKEYFFAQFFMMLRSMFFRADHSEADWRRVAQNCAILQQRFRRP